MADVLRLDDFRKRCIWCEGAGKTLGLDPNGDIIMPDCGHCGGSGREPRPIIRPLKEHRHGR